MDGSCTCLYMYMYVTVRIHVVDYQHWRPRTERRRQLQLYTSKSNGKKWNKMVKMILHVNDSLNLNVYNFVRCHAFTSQ